MSCPHSHVITLKPSSGTVPPSWRILQNSQAAVHVEVDQAHNQTLGASQPMSKKGRMCPWIPVTVFHSHLKMNSWMSSILNLNVHVCWQWSFISVYNDLANFIGCSSWALSIVFQPNAPSCDDAFPKYIVRPCRAPSKNFHVYDAFGSLLKI